MIVLALRFGDLFMQYIDSHYCVYLLMGWEDGSDRHRCRTRPGRSNLYVAGKVRFVLHLVVTNVSNCTVSLITYHF